MPCPFPTVESDVLHAATGSTHPNTKSSGHPGSIPAQNSLLLWGLFQRLPPPGTVWSQDDQVHWIETLKNVLTLEYKKA